MFFAETEVRVKLITIQAMADDFPSFDPNIFISPPYSQCPHCNTDNLGILIVSDQYCTQRCRGCGGDSGFRLPPIQKKLIYLDQFAISNFMKSLNEKHPSFGKGELLVWRSIFEKLDYLVKIQVVACPYSTVHEDESVVLDDMGEVNVFDSLKKMYLHLSNGKRLRYWEETRGIQFIRHFKSYVRNEKHSPLFSQSDIISSGVNAWRGNLMITVGTNSVVEYKDEILQARGAIHDEITSIFEEVWKPQNKGFSHWYNMEAKAAGREIMDEYVRSARASYAFDPEKDSPRDLLRIIDKYGMNIIQQCFSFLDTEGISDPEEQFRIVSQYVDKANFGEVPLIDVFSSLWANIAHEARNTTQSPPNRGTMNDAKVIAHCLPYFDAMLIDAPMVALMGRGEARAHLEGYKSRVFSGKAASLADFSAYLDTLIAEVSPEHMEYVRRVYGEDIKPFTGIYDQ